jgi:hypothetical protein
MSKYDFEIERNEGADEICLRSEEAQEIMGLIPSWIEHWGITVIGVMLTVILAGAALFPCPETLTGQFRYIPESTSSCKQTKCFAMLTAHGIGKVHKGQVVIIRLENYPDSEFGYLIGEVLNVANLSSENSMYKVSINLNQGMRTSKGFVVPTNVQMEGTAEIVVAEKRLIENFGPIIVF